MVILFHRPTAWESHLKCSSKIYAEMFRDHGHTVVYVQGVISVYHFIKRNRYFYYYKNSNKKVDGIYLISPNGYFPVIYKLGLLTNLLIKLNYFFSERFTRNKLKQFGINQIDVIWTTVPGSDRLFNLESLKSAIKIFNVIDNYSAYHGERINNLLCQTIRKADLVFTIGNVITRQIQSKMKNDNVESNKVITLGQGVDLKRFSNCLDVKTQFQKYTFRCVWTGASWKLDFDYLRITLDYLSNINGCVVVVGEINDELMLLDENYDNLFVEGPKKPSDVVGYLLSSNIGLMLYNRKYSEIYKGQNPLKLYEYAAAGLKIISTYHEEYSYLDAPVIEIHNREELSVALESVCSGNFRKSRDEIISFAKLYSWNSCFEKVIKELQKNKKNYG